MTRNLILALAAVALFAGFYVKGRYDGASLANATHAVALADAQAKQLSQTKRMMRDVDTLAQTFEADRAALVAGRDSAAAAVRGLRAALAARIARDTASSSGGDGGPIARALEQCADRYSELAAVADGYANQLIALQGWAGVVAPRE